MNRLAVKMKDDILLFGRRRIFCAGLLLNLFMGVHGVLIYHVELQLLIGSLHLVESSLR